MKIMSSVLFVSAISLSIAGCKKKEEAAPAPKPPVAEGSGSAVVAPTPTPTPTPTTPTEPPVTAVPAATKTIIEVATEAGTFKTLIAAVEAAGLVETLNGAGPFTVFAPTDEAFAKIPAKDLEALLADKAKLTAVLTYHVVAGAVMAKDVTGLTTAKTVNGAELPIDTTDGVKVGGAKVTATDIAASNGVIHVIDTVLMPPA